MDMNRINAKFKELAELKMMEDEIKAEKEAVEKELKAIMTEFNLDTLIGDEHKATYKEVVSNKFDSTAFKKDHADMYESYKKASTSMRFTFA